jgi:hypothetical protein
LLPLSFAKKKLFARATNWMDGAERELEAWYASSGILLKTSGGSDFYIAPDGLAIEQISKNTSHLTNLDRSILLGPALILSLALRNVLSLHASAAMYKENVIVFLGESGMGKSTLAAYLSKNAGWRLVADDILPVTYKNDLQILPHFPQLKLPLNDQPAIGLPEHLPLKTICVLERANADSMPELQKLSTAQTVQALLSHIAGTRIFSAELLAKHLEFSTQAAAQVTAYKLTNPHRREALSMIKELLERIC